MYCTITLIQQYKYIINTMIEIKNLSYSYKYNKKVLDDISLNISKGNIYGLLGKNGEGKSTLLKIICGLLEPDGICNIEGLSSFKKNKKLLEKIFFISETPFIPDIKVTKYAELLKSFYPNFSDSDFKAYLEEFEVPVNNRLKKMSLGQQKKAIISLALACNTEYLIMDEPTNGLDIPSKSKFRKITASLIDENKSVIISTHQVRDLENLINQIIIIDSNKVIMDASVNLIEEKLYFGEVLNNMEPLYYENSIKGNFGVMWNKENLMSNVDLEMLFNTVTTNKDAMVKEFAREEEIINKQ